MRKINDFSRYKNILPYDSEIFGVYQPMIGWKSKRIKQRIEKGFSADLNKARDQLFKRFRGDFEMVLDERGVLQKISRLETGGNDVPRKGAMGSFVIENLTRELPPLVRYDERLWDKLIDANRIRDVLDTWDFDGVGFDIEVNGIGPSEQSDTMKAWFKQGKTIKDWVVARPTSSDPAAKKEQAAADNIRVLYHTLAQLLITKKRFVSYATAAFVDAKSGKFDDGVYIFGHTRVQPIGLAAGRANVVARIMAYDEGFQAGGGKKTEKSAPAQDSLTKRHVQILKSITAAGVHPSTVQLGIKMVSLKDFGMKSGHMTVDQAVDRCADLRRFRTGLITFSGSTSSPSDEVAAFARYDKVLNESEFNRRYFLGVPFQAPH